MNPLTFYVKNKKKSIAIFVILLLSVFCISFITTLIKSVYDTCSEVNISPFECFSIVAAKSADAEVEEIENFDKVDKVIDGFTLSTSISTVFGTTNSYIVFSDDIKNIFNLCEFNLSEGYMPSTGANEIVVHESILKNKGLKVGDKMSDFEIVGSYKGKAKLSLGCMSDELRESYADGVYSYIVFSSNGELEAMNKQLSDLSNKKWEIFTYEKAYESLDDEFSTINIILLLVVIMVSFCLAIAMAALVYSIYSNRYDEFAILNAIGYKKRTIKKLILQETILISFVSWFCGYLLSLAGLSLADKHIYADMGQSMSIFTVDSLLYTLLIPFLVVVCTTIPSVWKLSRTDLINIVERR